MSLADRLTDAAPPQDVSLERALLGGILVEGAEAWSRVCERLREQDFSLEAHRQLWAAYRDLVADGLQIDIRTVRHATQGPPAWLAELADEAATLTALGSYAAMVRRLSAARDLIQLGTRMVQDTYEGADAATVATAAAGVLAEITGRAHLEAPKPPASAEHMRMAVDGVLQELDGGSTPSLVSLPYAGLNRLTGGGIAPGELMYLGGWASAGKTAMALDIARHVARQGRSVLIVSREMSRRLLATRLMAQEAGIDALSLRRGRLEPGERRALDLALPTIRRLPIWPSDDAEGLEDLRRLIREFDRAPALGLVIVDYLQLLRPPDGLREPRHQVEALSKGLKAVAGEYRLPTICLSSLSRAEDHRRPPVLSDLRDSGQLEHDADLVLFLHRPDRLAPETDGFLAKNRNGAIGRIALRFHPATLQFTEVSERLEV